MQKKPIIYAIDSGEYKPVTDANAGLTITPEDSQVILESILKLKLMSKEERRKLGWNGYFYARENHDYSKLTKKLVDICLS